MGIWSARECGVIEVEMNISHVKNSEYVHAVHCILYMYNVHVSGVCYIPEGTKHHYLRQPGACCKHCLVFSLDKNNRTAPTHHVHCTHNVYSIAYCS